VHPASFIKTSAPQGHSHLLKTYRVSARPCSPPQIAKVNPLRKTLLPMRQQLQALLPCTLTNRQKGEATQEEAGASTITGDFPPSTGRDTQEQAMALEAFGQQVGESAKEEVEPTR
jgi:hypothetical protein